MDSDVVHDFGNHPEWNESFYFNFYDRRMDICGFMRIGLKPNSNEKNAFCYFMMPDASVLQFNGREPALNLELRVGDLRFEKILPEKKWHLTFSGTMRKSRRDTENSEPVGFTADFECLNEVFDYRECVRERQVEISQEIASQHLEQFGRITGRLNTSTGEYALEGLGERDHSWGVRDWNAPKMWIWLTCQFSATSALNVTKLVMERDEVDAGFIHRDGRNIPLIKVGIETQWRTDGGPRSLDIALEDKAGNSHRVRAEVMREAQLPFLGRDGRKLSILYEPLARYAMGSDTGYGIAEYLIRKS